FSRRLGRGTPLRTPWHTRQWVPYRGIAAARTDFKDLPRRVPESDAPSAAAPGGRRAGEAGGTPWRAWRSAGGAPSALA
ncbi:unnamed protein product, partial [Prorocentrum cordatum]